MKQKPCEKIIRLLVRVACPSYEWNGLTERTKAWKAGCNMGYEAGLKGEPKPDPPPIKGKLKKKEVNNAK